METYSITTRHGARRGQQHVSSKASHCGVATPKLIKVLQKRNRDADDENDQFAALEDEDAIPSRTTTSRLRPQRKCIIQEDGESDEAVMENLPQGKVAGPACGDTDVILPTRTPAHWDLLNKDEGIIVTLPLKGDPVAGLVRVMAPSLRPAGIAEGQNVKSHGGGALAVAGMEIQIFETGAQSDGSFSSAEAAAAAGASGRTGDLQNLAKLDRKTAELERVLARIEAKGRVVRVERVQNPPLWSEYCTWTHQAAQPLERYLWCPLSTSEVREVIVKGFSALESTRPGGALLFMANTAFALEAVAAAEKAEEDEFLSALSAMPASSGNPALESEVLSDTASSIGTVRAVAMLDNIVQPFTSGSGARVTIARGGLKNLGASDKSPAGAAALAPPAPSTTSTKAIAGEPCRTPSPDFPGKGGALLLCRVSLGTMMMGSGNMAVDLATDTNDSIMDTKAMHASSLLGGAPRGIAASTDDPAWAVSGMFADSLVVVLRRPAAQAYPEYIVHFD